MCQVHTHELQCSSACLPAPCLRRALEGFVGVDVERLQVVQRLKEEAVIIGRVATVYARIILPTNLRCGRHDIGHGELHPFDSKEVRVKAGGEIRAGLREFFLFISFLLLLGPIHRGYLGFDR